MCSHNETDKTMTQVNTNAPTPNVAHVHIVCTSTVGPDIPTRFALKPKHLPFLNANNVGMAV